VLFVLNKDTLISMFFSVQFVPVYDQRAGQYIYNKQVVEIVFKGGEPLALYECGRHMVCYIFSGGMKTL
jgi:hypothetical protein